MTTRLRLGRVLLTGLGLAAALLAARGRQAEAGRSLTVQPRVDLAGKGACPRAVCGPGSAPRPVTRPDGALQDVLNELIAEGQSQSSLQDAGDSDRSESTPRVDARQLAVLAHRCAPGTPTDVIASLVANESGGRPLVLSTNSRERVRYTPGSRRAAAAILTELQARGASVDVGLMQLNTVTLRRLGVAADEALDPCRNIALGAQVFDAGYAAAFARHRPTLMLLSAYSTYNTGDPERGVRNGYADRVAVRLHAEPNAATGG